MSAGVGYMGFNGDSVLSDGLYGTLRLSRNCNRWFSLEGLYYYAPAVDGDSEEQDPEVNSSWTTCLGADCSCTWCRRSGAASTRTWPRGWA